MSADWPHHSPADHALSGGHVTEGKAISSAALDPEASRRLRGANVTHRQVASRTGGAMGAYESRPAEGMLARAQAHEYNGRVDDASFRIMQS